MAGNVTRTISSDPQEFIDNPDLLAEWMYKVSLELDRLSSTPDVLKLTDGTAEPDHSDTDAQIYIDEADGLLKIKGTDDVVEIIAIV